MHTILICSHDASLLPEKKTPEAACRDIKAAEDVRLAPGTIHLVKTGIKTFIPSGRYCRIYARSSLPLKTGLTLANSVAIIDSDYRGEYFLQLMNITGETVEITSGTRLCQIEFCPHYRGDKQFGTAEIPGIEMRVDAELFEHFEEQFQSDRGTGGFGSTGTH